MPTSAWDFINNPKSSGRLEYILANIPGSVSGGIAGFSPFKSADDALGGISGGLAALLEQTTKNNK